MAHGKFDFGDSAFVLRQWCHQWHAFNEQLLPDWNRSVNGGNAPLWAIPVDLTKLRINVGELLP